MANIVLPQSEAKDAAYTLALVSQYAGYIGVLVYNAISLELPSGRKLRASTLQLIVCSCLIFLSPTISFFLLLLLRFALIRGGSTKPDLSERKTILFLVFLILVVMLYVVNNADVVDYIFLILLFALSPLYLAGKQSFWLPTVKISEMSQASIPHVLVNILCRTSYDLYLLMVSVSILYLASNYLELSQALDFIKIYSVVGVSGMFVAAIEGKVLSRVEVSAAQISIVVVLISCILSGLFVMCWLLVVENLSISVAILATIGAIMGVLVGHIGASLRRDADPVLIFKTTAITTCTLVALMAVFVTNMSHNINTLLFLMVINLIMLYLSLLVVQNLIKKRLCAVRI